MTIGTVCSGIGAPEIAFDAEPLWFSEIEKFPSAVLAHHYPQVPNLGDFTSEEAQQHMVDNPPDVFMGGTPCQAFSVAGKRESLEDDRGNLTLAFVEVWHRLRAVGTRYCVWENVPGVLSTKDNAFGCFLAGMVGAEHPITVNGRWTGAGMVSGQKGVVAWRTLDAQHWGVPQRRRRIFAVVGHPGDFSVAKILFEPEGVFGDSEASGETGEGVARGVGEGTINTGWDAQRMRLHDSEGIAPTLSQSDGGGGQRTLNVIHRPQVYENHPNDSRVKGPLEICEQLTARNGTGGGNLPLGQEAQVWPEVGPCLQARDYKGPSSFRNGEMQNVVVEPIPIHDKATRHAGHDAGRKNADGAGNGFYVGKEGDVHYTLTSGDKHAVGFHARQTPVSMMGKSLPIEAQGGQAVGEYKQVDTTGEPLYIKGINHITKENGDVTETERRPSDSLQKLWKTVSAEAITLWGLGITLVFLQKEILQHEMLWRIACKSIFGRESIIGKKNGEESEIERFLRDLWESGCKGRAPSGWRLSEQFSKELATYLSELPQQGSRQKTFMYDLWGTAERARILQQAFDTMEEIWRSDGLQDSTEEAVQGVWKTCQCSWDVWKTLYASKEKGNFGVMVVRRLTPL
tara:strand:- start:147 stop:2027 length:1881 start_codon:yes stop_codon:yes gene_type:complete